jgi:hypothetical protein
LKFSRYDVVHVLGAIFRLGGLKPDIIRQGTKLMELRVKKKGIVPDTRFIDTYNIMPVALAKLPATFELQIEGKEWFPHLYNKRENLGVRLPHLPSCDDYMYKSKKQTDKEAFEKWYEEHRNEEFFLDEKLAEYCCNDVRILAHAVVRMRQYFMEISKGIDIFRTSITIASACMRHFRTNHLKRNRLALVRESGYEKHYRQSTLALKFLKYYAHHRQLDLRYADSVKGEYFHVDDEGGGAYLDGYYEHKGERVAIEVNGCFFHGCPSCFPDPHVKLHAVTAATRYRQTMERGRESSRGSIKSKSTGSVR